IAIILRIDDDVLYLSWRPVDPGYCFRQPRYLLIALPRYIGIEDKHYGLSFNRFKYETMVIVSIAEWRFIIHRQAALELSFIIHFPLLNGLFTLVLSCS